MLICRTPFRISLFGGGTDYPAWYKYNSGAVISSTINKYSYITLRDLPPFFDFKYRIRYYLKEEVNCIEEINHPSVRESLKYIGYEKGIEMVHNADLPARSGLGSSSTFTVGMIHSLNALKNNLISKKQLSADAIHVEQKMIKESVGSQDQIAAAYGGLNHITFNKDDDINVQQILMSKGKYENLQENLLLCFTGFARTASDLAAVQIKETKNKSRELDEMKMICEEGLKLLSSSSAENKPIGELLDSQWKIKRGMTSQITNSLIDEIYDTALKNGAYGGKLLGAGGGGFMLFYAEKEKHQQIKEALNSKMFVPFEFESTGSSIIYYTRED